MFLSSSCVSLQTYNRDVYEINKKVTKLEEETKQTKEQTIKSFTELATLLQKFIEVYNLHIYNLHSRQKEFQNNNEDRKIEISLDYN
jgi:hypothetical protein